VKRPGKVKGVAELQLAFDQIRLPDNRGSNFSAEVVELVDMGNRDGGVDSEGGVKGEDSTKDDVSKVGAATGIGAIIGAIFGGGKGAAIGAAVGGAAGTGRVLTKRGQDIRLERGRQLRIRTASETRIQ
jgi:outer membrane lipoprotein SlyB